MNNLQKGLLVLSQFLVIFILVSLNLMINLEKNKSGGVSTNNISNDYSFDLAYEDLLQDKSKNFRKNNQVLSAKSENKSGSDEKSEYKIAVIGDSMVETMGGNLEYLKVELEKKYPTKKFIYYNYGKGSENIKEALDRFDTPFSYKDKNYEPITTLKPDILIVGSYAYNPLVPYNRDFHWSYLADLVNKAKSVSDKVYMLAEIAPLEDGFGKGPGGIDWQESAIKTHVEHIIEQLDNAHGLAATLGVELIDANTDSRMPDSKYGNRDLVDNHDGIHPSIDGHKFMARKIAEKIVIP